MNDHCYDKLIKDAVIRHFTELEIDLGPLAWLWIRAQIRRESNFNPHAVSPVGAMGLMQLMPATAKELGVTDPFDPEQNINGGVFYLADQYRHLREIPVHIDRLKFALASYNGGRGYINLALALARQDTRLPFGFRAWRRAGSPAGAWQLWQHGGSFLGHPRCHLGKRRPDYHQMWAYVAHIEDHYTRYFREATCPNKAAAPTA